MESPRRAFKLGPYSRPLFAPARKIIFRLGAGFLVVARDRGRVVRSMIPRRMRERSSPIGAVLGLALATLLGAAACGEHSASRVAARVLEKYRKTSGAKPLTASGMIRLRLSGADGAAGKDEILWAPRQYRETVASAGMTVVH